MSGNRRNHGHDKITAKVRINMDDQQTHRNTAQSQRVKAKKGLEDASQRVSLEEDKDASLSSDSIIDCNKENGAMLMEGMDITAGACPNSRCVMFE